MTEFLCVVDADRKDERDNGDNQHHEDRFVPGGDHTVRDLSELPALLHRHSS